ncbi:MAG: phage regulatory CII family protein [Hydrogenophaga sp.]|nr:phage regulatory CII family protein [Hydrogenophaga sp.]
MPGKHEIDHANPFEAFRRLVYRHDVKKLAPRMGMKAGTLYNKADADTDSHNQPTLRDVVSLTELTGDYSVLDALNEMFGRAAFDVAPHAQVSDAALLELLTQLGIEKGDFHRALHEALEDGKFSTKELQQIRATAFDLVSALMTLVARVEGLRSE